MTTKLAPVLAFLAMLTATACAEDFLLLSDEAAKRMARCPDPDSPRYRKKSNESASTLQSAGVLVRGSALKPAASAATVVLIQRRPTVRRGESSTMPARFAGYLVLKVANEAEALRWTLSCPAALTGGNADIRRMLPKMSRPEPTGPEPKKETTR